MLCDRQACIKEVPTRKIANEETNTLPSGQKVYTCDFHDKYFAEDKLLKGTFLIE